ncbi:MAG: sigma-54-dependent Fis family transcriptional regulator [Ignavibacteriales bacterium]|nr:sigma-54-dependent Fis family transcriptional regulator [Ignavibacteriales bacterium]
MPVQKVWIYFHRNFDPLYQNRILNRFENAGLETILYKGELHSFPGIIMFDSIDPILNGILLHNTEVSMGRILAIAIDKSMLTNNISWQLLNAGASDVLTWQDSDDFVQNILKRIKRWETIDGIVQSPLVQNNLIGESVKWKCLLQQIVEIAYYTDASVLITGETGTGKELVARLIHSLDQREKKGDLVIVDCTTIVPELSGSEFFGHERGAYTGAIQSRDGAFALANNGTLFLDEVGELPLHLQAELMRVIQEGTYKRVGSNVWQNTKFRLICATNKNLTRELKDGHFRHDFYYRIAGYNCNLLPLRERTEDILSLVKFFLNQQNNNSEPFEVDECLRAYLIMRDYPGNIRDLKQLVSRIMYRHVGKGPITIGDIPEDERPHFEEKRSQWCDQTFESCIRKALLCGVKLKEIGKIAENIAIGITEKETNGNLRHAAEKLGVTNRTLQLRRANSKENHFHKN